MILSYDKYALHTFNLTKLFLVINERRISRQRWTRNGMLCKEIICMLRWYFVFMNMNINIMP